MRPAMDGSLMRQSAAGEASEQASGPGWTLHLGDCIDYFEIACRRLRGEEAKPQPEQPSLF